MDFESGLGSGRGLCADCFLLNLRFAGPKVLHQRDAAWAYGATGPALNTVKQVMFFSLVGFSVSSE